MLVYGKNVAKRILLDEKINKKVRKIYIDEVFYKKNQNLFNKFLIKRIEIKQNLELDKLAKGVHQGIILDMEDYQYASFDEIVINNYSFVLILDHILDPHNLGAIIRSAVASGVQSIIIPKDRQVAINATVIKTSVGAIFDIPVVEVVNLRNSIGKLKENGFWIYGTALDGDDYRGFDYGGKVAIVIGNEEKGISNIVRRECDFLVTIPQSSKLDSLNASVAAGIMMYEVVRNRK